MHLPDGFISNGVSVPLIGVAVAVGVAAISKVRSAFLKQVPVLKQKLATFPNIGGSVESSMQSVLTRAGKENLWRMASVGAFIFAAQMVNFQVMEGVSGHLLGGVLVALILGPWAGFIVMSVVLAMQALMFGDGGIVALGANIVNMGVIACIGGWYAFQWLHVKTGKRKKFFLILAAFVAWVSVVAASAGASIELIMSGTASLSAILPDMIGTHALIGAGEGLITFGVLVLLLRKQERIAAMAYGEED
ncbi:MAG: energy-coupling factor ABC transporter permease [Parcubacteria group bacterium]